MTFKEKTVNKNYVYRGKIINVRADDALSVGGNCKREIVEHPGGSAVLCEKDGKILLERQFRYAFSDELWEIPAGKLEPGEDPQKAAIRELEEECGIKAEKAELIFTAYPSPGYTDEIIRIYRATGLSRGEKHFDSDEDINSFWVDKKEIKKMIDSGEIKDAKTLIALLYALNEKDDAEI